MERTDYEQQEVSVWNKNIEPPLLIQMFYDFIIDEENRIRKRNHEKKFQKRDLYKEISENINLSEDIVKRCQGIKIEGRPEKFLLGCVEAGMKHRVSAERIKEFVEVCTDSCWTYYKYKVEIENHMENKNRLEYYRQKDNENRYIICPQVLKNKLDTFLEKSKKRFLYLAGTYKSGITASVIKYFEEKDYGKTPQIFDFYNKEMTEIKTCMALKAALWSQQYVIIHIGLQTFPLSQMNFWGDGKVILIAHTPCENLYLKNMDYVVFNDLVNQKRCTEELLKTYVPELLYGNRDCQDILISRINEKTGGIPLAVYRLGNAIFEKELLRYEGNLEKFFALPLYLNPELESVYEDMWKDFMEDTWNKVSTDTQILLGCASYFTGDISLDLLKCLLGNKMTDERWRTALSQAYQYMLVMESGRNQQNGENGNFRGVRLFPIVKQLIRFKCWEESEYEKYMDKSVDFYMEKINTLDVDALYSGEKIFLDRGGELMILEEVLQFCNTNQLDSKYLSLTGNNLADFFFMRSKKMDLADDINEERRKVAERCQNHIQVLETYGMLMRRCIARNKKDYAQENLKKAEEYLKKHVNIDIYDCSRFLNGKAVVLFNVRSEIREAQKIWEEMLENCTLSDREISWCKRWKLKCVFRLKSDTLDRMAEMFQSGYAMADDRKYYRAAVDYLLYTVRCYLLMYVQDPSDKGYINGMEESLNKTDSVIKLHPFLDEQYKSGYYYLNCCFMTIKGLDTKEELQKACEAARKANELNKYKACKALLAVLSKKWDIKNEKWDFEYEQGEIYDFIINCC